MLASDRAKATYAKLQRQGIAATMCRGTTGDDFNFFYSDFSYWSNYCLGWVPDNVNKPKICVYCSLVKTPVREFAVITDNDETRKEPRNSNRVPRQPTEQHKPGTSAVSELHTGGKHVSSGSKSNAATKTKKKKTKKLPKAKKRAGK